MDFAQIAVIIVCAGVAGWIATLFLGSVGLGVIGNIGLGLIGGLVGIVVLPIFLSPIQDVDPLVDLGIRATVGSIVLLLAANLMKGR
jgi:uncharacterized membrane protein YeaQ/YmgE (transglycosylase-associated protein family)